MFLHDVRHGIRLLGRERGFAMAAVLTLALGVGANVSVFALVDAVLLRPLPYPEAGRLMMVHDRDRSTGITKPFIAIGDYVDLHARQRAFAALADFGSGRLTVTGGAEPYDVEALAAGADLFRVLGVQPLLGRAIDPADTLDGAPPVVMLGYDLWQSRFAGDPRIVGRSIDVGHTRRQIVGVAPRGFAFPAGAVTDAIVPLTTPLQAPAARKSGWRFAVARLKPGETLAGADADLGTVSQQMAREHPQSNQGSTYFAVPLRDAAVGDSKPALLLLLGAVGLVLVIACANVANLLVARALGRRQEIAIRVALGAARSRLFIQLLAESLVLAGAAAVAALLAAYWLIPTIAQAVPESLRAPGIAEARIDTRVFLFALAAAGSAAMAFGLLSTFGSGIDATGATLVSPARVAGGRSTRRASSILVAAEMALAIVLLAGAGLVLRSFARLIAVDPGFDPANVLTMDVELPDLRYHDPKASSEFYEQAFGAIRAIPGVTAAGAAIVTPLTGNNWTIGLERADHPAPAGTRPPEVGWQSATGGYFRALRIPLRAGRLFDDRDRSGPPVVIVSESIQRRYFPGESAVGRHVRTSDGPAEIVGVVGDIRRASLTDAPREDLYLPMEHSFGTQVTLFVRSARDASGSAPSVRAALRRIEPGIAIRDVTTMERVTADSVQVTRLALWLLGVFALTALLLAAVGIYGVMAAAVRQRTREIGTRIALGASPDRIVRLIVFDGARVAAAGAAIGLCLSGVTGRAVGSLLFATSPLDPLVLVGASCVLLATAAAASWLPARRATRLDPVRTLSPE